MNVQATYTYGLNASGADYGKDSQGIFANAVIGQEIEGTITKASDEISINFSGKAISVPKSSVLNAKEGESKKFKIMDISKERIVLKEVGTSTTDRSVNEKTNSPNIKDNSYANLAKNKKINNDAVSKEQESKESDRLYKYICILSVKDMQRLESSGKNISDMTADEIASYLSNSINFSDNYVQNDEYCEKTEDISQIVDNMQSIHNELVDKLNETLINEQKLDKNVDNIYENKQIYSDIVTQFYEQSNSYPEENTISKIEDMLLELSNMINIPIESSNTSEDLEPVIDFAAVKYLMENDMPLTVENIYKARHAGYYTEQKGISEEEFANISNQIIKIIEKSGMEVNQASIQKAKWLVDNNIPVNSKNLFKLEKIENINTYSIKDVISNAVNVYFDGRDVNEISLEYSYKEYKSTMIQINTISDDNIAETIKQNKEINIANLSSIQNISNIEKNKKKIYSNSEIVIRRQLEEIRLSMTAISSYKLTEKGIDIRTEELSKLVEELKNIENQYYKELLGTENYNEYNADVLKETLTKVKDIKIAPAYILGTTLSVQKTISFTEFHAQSIDATSKLANETYEKLMTSPRKDLGDSIKKAFRNVDELLDNIGLEHSKTNERAVRILGYNQMEITTENVENMKVYDAKVNELISNLTPTTTVELIKKQINPLNMTINELCEKTIEIKQADENVSDEKYSEFLWKLDNSNQLSESEREGYIGIYRLVNAINRSDGAVIGATVNAGMELTLSNLLTSYRTARKSSIDVNIDDDFGVIDKLITNKKSISEQISQAFINNNSDEINKSTEENAKIILRNLEKSLSENYIENMLDKDVDVLNVSIDELIEQMQNSDEIKANSFYEGKLKELREVTEINSESAKILNNLGMNCTINNLFSVSTMINGNGIADSIKKIVKKVNREVNASDDEVDTNKNTESETDIIESIFGNITEYIVDKETLTTEYDKVSQKLNDIINEAKAVDNITAERFDELRNIGQNIRFNLNLSKRECYDIPLVINNEITNINLTIINNNNNNNNNNQVNISIYSDRLGKITAEFIAKEEGLKGLILADSQKTSDILKDAKDNLIEELKREDVQIINLDYVVGTKKMNYSQINDNNSDISNKKLYSVARTIIISIKNIESTI